MKAIMTYFFYLVVFMVLNTTTTIHAQQTIIPVASEKFNHQITHEQTTNKVTKKIKRNFIRHSKFKKACIYSGCALGGILAGICLFTFGIPIIISTILIGIEIFVRIKGSLIKITY